MVDWQVTATTIYCDAVEDEVTLMVYGDWSVQCTGYRRYGESVAGQAALKSRARRTGRPLGCSGPECPRAVEYRARLLAEESSSEQQATD